MLRDLGSVKWNMKIYKTGIAHHLDALRAGVQVGNQFSSRIGYKDQGGNRNEKKEWNIAYLPNNWRTFYHICFLCSKWCME